MNLSNLKQELLQNNGFSYNINTGEFNPNYGYFVSIRGFEEAFNLSDFDDADIKRYLAIHSEQLADHGKWLGGWVEDGKVYLDVSLKTEFLERAIYLGILNDQKAVYDAYKSKVINIPSPQRSGTEYQQRFYAQHKALEIVNKYNESLKDLNQ
jgi:hypothetical protein